MAIQVVCCVKKSTSKNTLLQVWLPPTLLAVVRTRMTFTLARPKMAASRSGWGGVTSRTVRPATKFLPHGPRTREGPLAPCKRKQVVSPWLRKALAPVLAAHDVVTGPPPESCFSFPARLSVRRRQKRRTPCRKCKQVVRQARAPRRIHRTMARPGRESSGAPSCPSKRRLAAYGRRTAAAGLRARLLGRRGREEAGVALSLRSREQAEREGLAHIIDSCFQPSVLESASLLFILQSVKPRFSAVTVNHDNATVRSRRRPGATPRLDRIRLGSLRCSGPFAHFRLPRFLVANETRCSCTIAPAFQDIRTRRIRQSVVLLRPVAQGI